MTGGNQTITASLTTSAIGNVPFLKILPNVAQLFIIEWFIYLYGILFHSHWLKLRKAIESQRQLN